MTANDFIVEIGSGELPPKALRTLSAAFADGIEKGLRDAGLNFSSLEKFAAPRRLAVRVKGLDRAQQDRSQERFGPALSAAYDKEGNPTPAASGFARSCGVELSELEQQEKDGAVKLVYRSMSKGREAVDLLPGIVSDSLQRLPIPRKMRWGSSREEFVRPVHWLLMLFGGKVIDTTLFGISSGNSSRGHRFHHDEAITINSPAEYEEKLLTVGKVQACYEQRKSRVRELVLAEGEKLSAEVVIEDDLLEEVTSMVEWPVALTGRFDTEFLQVPAEALISSLKNHQKCFYLRDSTGALLPNFVAVSNIESRDPAQVIAGNERVIRPRLADAAFFFETDKKQSLASRREHLKTIVFQQELGTVYDKSERVARLAVFMAGELGVNSELCERAAQLAKCDLLSNMVSEFAELQGIMGFHYARHDGEHEEVALALNEQYMPRFSGDSVPGSSTGCVVAIADKLDTIVGLFSIGQPPTGSRDPFALRRAALGILRILVEKRLDLNLVRAIRFASEPFSHVSGASQAAGQVFEFMLERFRAWYQAEGISAEVFQSVFVLKPPIPLDFDMRIQAVHRFTQLPESASLAAANKRVSNILQKQGGENISVASDASLYTETAEQELAALIDSSLARVRPLFDTGQYTEGLEELAATREAVDRFFDEVLVMADDPRIRSNRLALINQLRNLFLEVADISCLHPS